MESLPRLVILDSPPELRLLRAWVANPSMPTVDLDAFYGRFFDTVLSRDVFYHHGLYSLAAQLAHSDELYGNNTLEQMARDQLEQLICQAGHAVYNRWREAKLNHPSGAPLYRFREYQDDSVLIFERADLPKRPGTLSPARK